jgi:hypothetical protein
MDDICHQEPMMIFTSEATRSGRRYLMPTEAMMAVTEPETIKQAAVPAVARIGFSDPRRKCMAKQEKTGWTLVMIGVVVLALMSKLDWLPVLVPASILVAYSLGRMSHTTG